MKIEETRISLINQLVGLVNKYCAKLKIEDDVQTLFFLLQKKTGFRGLIANCTYTLPLQRASLRAFLATVSGKTSGL